MSKRVNVVNKLLLLFNWRDTSHVKTGSEQGSYANPQYQVTAVAVECFMVPVLDVFLTPQYANWLNQL